GWAGVQAIPRILTLDHKNRLVMTPVENLKALYTTGHHFTAADCDAEPLPVSGTALDIYASFNIDSDEACGLILRSAANNAEYTEILYQPDTGALHILRHYDDANVETFAQGVLHPLDDGESLDLRILLDGSVLEVIANKRSSVTSRIYPSQSGEQNVSIQNAAMVASLIIHEVASIW
ncbi:MAG: GH32 C-terminal domain-containing protein, partial [Aggregatilineales bacterium]